MITLTRLSGSAFVLNSDLIERIDSSPDTVITLVDGTKYIVAEGMHEVVDAVSSYRGGLVALSGRLAEAPEPAEQRRLAAVSPYPGARSFGDL